MATEKQLQAVAKMQEAKRRKAEERERLKMQEQESNNYQEEEEEEEVEVDDEENDSHKERNESNDVEMGLKIEAELKSLYDSNNREISARDLKSQAPKTYNVIFENYEEGETNGIETSYYRLIEKENQVYSISKI
jgi:hypothetical protein